MNKTTKKIINYFLSPIIFIGLSLLIYHQITNEPNFKQDLQQLIYHASSISLTTLLLLLILSPVNWTVEAIKWKFLTRKFEPLNFPKALASVLTGMSIAFISPGKVGDFAGRALYFKNKHKLSAGIATILGNISQTICSFIAGAIGMTFIYLKTHKEWAGVLAILCSFSILILLLLFLNLKYIAQLKAKRRLFRKIIFSFKVLKKYSKNDLLKITLLSGMRFLVYNFQFLLVCNLLGASINWEYGLLLTAAMFWLIAVIPSMLIADLGVRAFVANLIFTTTALASNSIAILSGSYVIWLLNWLVPAIIGSILTLTIKINKT